MGKGGTGGMPLTLSGIQLVLVTRLQHALLGDVDALGQCGPPLRVGAAGSERSHGGHHGNAS
jgi:hypothetical protein